MKFFENYRWKNKHRTLDQVVQRLYNVNNIKKDGSKPNNATERTDNAITLLKDILLDADQEMQKDPEKKPINVRVIGSGWSLSRVLETNDFLVNTKPLNLIVPNLKRHNIEAKHDNNQFVFAQCGASVKELNQTLEKHGKGLPTTGASDGQTIVGAISTGTHGSAINVGSMPDYVTGLHLIISKDYHIWLEGTERIATDAFVKSYLPGATRVNDDQHFQAALVSMGCFGIIHAVLLSTVEAYHLRSITKHWDWERVKRCIDGPGNYQELGLRDNPHHFEVLLNPFNLKRVVVTAMYKMPVGPIKPLPGVKVKMGWGIDLFSVIGAIDKFVGNHSDELMRILDNFFIKNYPEKDETDAPRFIFGGSESGKEEPAKSIEIGIDAGEVSKVMVKILDEANKHPFIGVIALRYIKQSKAMLSFAKFPITCAIEIPAVRSQHTQAFYEALWQRLNKDGVNFTFHLGQMNNLNQDNIQNHLPSDILQKWMQSREALMDAGNRKMFANKFLQDIGLDS